MSDMPPPPPPPEENSPWQQQYQQGPIMSGGYEEHVQYAELPAWEDTERGFFERLWETFRASNFSPGDFFDGVEPDGPIPWGYLVIMAMLGVIGQTIPQLALQALFGAGSMAQNPQAQQDPMAFMVGYGVGAGGGLLCGLILAPVAIITGFFLMSCIYHVCLMLFGGANGGFNATLRTTAYAMGSAQAWLLIPIPCLMPLVSTVFQYIMLIVGYQRVHETDTWRSALAVFIPLILCTGLAILVVVLLFGAAIAASGGGGYGGGGGGGF